VASATWIFESNLSTSVYITDPFVVEIPTLKSKALTMPPTSPWGKKPQPNNSSTGFPSIKTPKPKDDPALKSQYEEIQEDELIALASIYGEDFRSIERKQTAWQVRGYNPLPGCISLADLI